MNSKFTSDSEKKPLHTNSKIKISTLQLGIWKVRVAAHSSGFGLQDQIRDLRSSFPILLRLAKDIFTLAPGIVLAIVACQIWEGVENALEMQISNRLLRTIEYSLREGRPNVASILSVVVAHLVWSVIAGLMTWWSTRMMMVLQARITVHFDVHLMKATLDMDLPTSTEPGSKKQTSSREIWQAVDTLIRFFTQLLKTTSQLALIVHISRSAGGPLFALMCIARPLFSALFAQALWDKTCIAFWNDQDHTRMKSLENLANEDQYKEQVFSGNLSNWILTEYKKASRARGDKLDTHPFYAFSVRDMPVFDVVYYVLSSLPMVRCPQC